jgi:hypothetical protein
LNLGEKQTGLKYIKNKKPNKEDLDKELETYFIKNGKS